MLQMKSTKLSQSIWYSIDVETLRGHSLCVGNFYVQLHTHQEGMCVRRESIELEFRQGCCIAQITCAARCSQVQHRSTPSSVSFPYVSININGVRWALNGKGGRIVALSIQVSLPRSQWFPNTPRFAFYETASSVTNIPDQPPQLNLS